MITAFEDTAKPIFKRARKKRRPFVNELQKLTYFIAINNNRLHKKEPLDKNKQEIDKEAAPPLKGLPPQPKEYLKYPDCDWF